MAPKAAMSGVALLFLAVAARLALAERDSTMAFTVEADSHFEKAAQARASTNSTSLSRHETYQREKQRVLDHIKAFSMEPMNIADFHVHAQEILLEAVMIFSAAHPDVAAGVQKIGDGLLECLEKLLPWSVTQSKQFDKLKAAWKDVFANLPKVDDGIPQSVDEYANKAKPEELAKVVAINVKAAIQLIKTFLPAEVSSQVEHYFEGITEIMDGIVQGWTAFCEGKTVQGIEFVYDGIQEAADEVLPDTIKNNEAYKVIMGTLDKQVKKLNDHVLKFKRRLEESKVCWRDDMKRNKAFARKCGEPAWPGYYYAGHGMCFKDSASLLETSEDKRRTLDQALDNKGSAPAPPPAPKVLSGGEGGKRQALCDLATQEEHDGRCLDKCPAGFVQTEDGLRCLTACWGNKSFPAATLRSVADGNMCGESPQIIQMVKAEMAVAIVAAAMQVMTVVQQMITDGKASADALSSIIDGVIALAVPFNNPECEVEGDEGDDEEHRRDDQELRGDDEELEEELRGNDEELQRGGRGGAEGDDEE